MSCADRDAERQAAANASEAAGEDLHIRLRDKAGAPVADAFVWVYSFASGQSRPAEALREGVYRIELQPRDGNLLYMNYVAPGFARCAELRPVARETTEVGVVLSPESRLNGVVKGLSPPPRPHAGGVMFHFAQDFEHGDLVLAQSLRAAAPSFLRSSCVFDVTDGDGRFALDTLPAPRMGVLQFRPSGPRQGQVYLWVVGDVASSAAAESSELVTFDLAEVREERVELALHVVDARNGESLPEAQLTLRGELRGRRYAIDLPVEWDAAQSRHVVTVFGAPFRTGATLVVSAPGYGEEHSAWPPAEGGLRVVRLHKRQAAALELPRTAPPDTVFLLLVSQDSSSVSVARPADAGSVWRAEDVCPDETYLVHALDSAGKSRAVYRELAWETGPQGGVTAVWRKTR